MGLPDLYDTDLVMEIPKVLETGVLWLVEAGSEENIDQLTFQHGVELKMDGNSTIPDHRK